MEIVMKLKTLAASLVLAVAAGSANALVMDAAVVGGSNYYSGSTDWTHTLSVGQFNVAGAQLTGVTINLIKTGLGGLSVTNTSTDAYQIQDGDDYSLKTRGVLSSAGVFNFNTGYAYNYYTDTYGIGTNINAGQTLAVSNIDLSGSVTYHIGSGGNLNASIGSGSFSATGSASGKQSGGIVSNFGLAATSTIGLRMEVQYEYVMTTPSQAPEPNMLALVGIAALGVWGASRRRVR
jgi:hypothetical protein